MGQGTGRNERAAATTVSTARTPSRSNASSCGHGRGPTGGRTPSQTGGHPGRRPGTFIAARGQALMTKGGGPEDRGREALLTWGPVLSLPDPAGPCTGGRPQIPTSCAGGGACEQQQLHHVRSRTNPRKRQRAADDHQVGGVGVQVPHWLPAGCPQGRPLVSRRVNQMPGRGEGPQADQATSGWGPGRHV